MGQYRLAVYFIKQLGFCVGVNSYQIAISLPFIDIYIGVTKEAKGVNLFDIFEW